MKSLKDFKLSVQVGAGSSKVSYGPRRPAPMDLAVDPSPIGKIDAERTTQSTGR